MSRVAAIVLAAGASRRMGAPNKLLAQLDGESRPMLARVIDTLLDSALDPLVLVLGHEAERVRAALGPQLASAGQRLHVVVNSDYGEGMASSIRAGVAALTSNLEGSAQVDAVLVTLGDMPWVRSDDIARLLAAFASDAGHGICIPTAGGARGNPVLFARRYLAELSALAGDRGARAVIARHADDVGTVEIGHDGVLRDVDTPSALRGETNHTDGED